MNIHNIVCWIVYFPKNDTFLFGINLKSGTILKTHKFNSAHIIYDVDDIPLCQQMLNANGEEGKYKFVMLKPLQHSIDKALES